MPRTLIRYCESGLTRWGMLDADKIAPLPFQAISTGDLLRENWTELTSGKLPLASLERSAVTLLSPVTPNQQFLCQGINYTSHVKESGIRLEDVPFNMLFTKASSSMTAADAPVERPPNVRLLDYEIELGLIVRRDIPQNTKVGQGDLHQWLAGITIVNDLSARDIQLPQGQFYKGKSYRGFGPIGPGIVLLGKSDWSRLPDLHMQLSVNGKIRQNAYCREMIYTPDQTLSEFSALQDLHAGDVIATGTPAGCAARAPGPLTMFLLRHFFSDRKKWEMFVAKGANNPAYLQPGDEIEASIRTDDGAIDLGVQTTRIIRA